MSIASQDSNFVRDAKINNLRFFEEKNINPYPPYFKPSHKADELQTKYKDLADGEKTEDEVIVAGRVMAYRNSGMFIDLHDVTGSIQIFSHKQDLSPEQLECIAHYDLGDIIGVKGYVRRTPRGELTVNAVETTLLTKSLQPLPDKFHGVTDTELRYRQRYVDLIASPDVRETFRQRSRIIQSIRKTLDNKGYLEVETPMLHVIPGGTSAKPFTTHHNALDMELFLRIAPELYLKRLVVGGMADGVYEVNRNFRNEGISVKHNPEFTMLEVYVAYNDYNDMMDLTEELIQNACKEANNGELKVQFGDKEIDFSGPWPRKTMTELVNEKVGVDFMALTDAAAAYAKAKELHVPDIKEGMNWGQIVAATFEHFVEGTLINPTHVIDFPRDISPLAKVHRDNPILTERFEVYANGWELGNAFSELNDPIDQLNRFKAQVEQREAGDDEAMFLDSDFVNALEYGMPPTGGLGIGIDRVVMLLTNSASIRDVIAFPTLRNK